jgi:cell division protein FtsW
LNVTEDHLDRYTSFDEYARAKGNAFVNQTPDDVAIIPGHDSIVRREAGRGRGRLVTFGDSADYSVAGRAVVERATGERFSLDGTDFHGAHNLSNAAAAIAVARFFGASKAQIETGLAAFRALGHRMAFVREINGVRYYDDSKATNVGAAVTALLGLTEERAVLLAGGRAHRRRDRRRRARRARGEHGRSRGARPRAREARGRRAPFSGLRELRHVPELRRPRRSLCGSSEEPLVEAGVMTDPKKSDTVWPQMGPVDPVLAAVVVALVGFGVVMVFSASTIEATVTFHDPYYFLKKQGAYAVLALGVMTMLSRLDYHRLRPLTYPLLAGITGLLLLSVVGFGHSGGGAARWLRFGPVNFQPSEGAKVALILWLAYSLEKKREQVRSFSIGMLPHFLMAGVLMLLCLKQPDFGGALVLLLLTFTLLFVAGARLGYLLGALIIGAAAGAWLVRSKAYRWERVLAWFNMAEHRQDLAYQPFQSVMSFGSGQGTGMGLGRGLQVLYLPEAHTDFISAIIGEELGFIGILGLCVAYLVIVARGVRTALRAEDEYGSYVAFGISVLFGLQALINLAVAMAVLPTKGLTLPFVSYGGSSLLVSSAAMGVLLNISRERSDGRRVVVGRAAEASALVASEADFAPDEDARGLGLDASS